MNKNIKALNLLFLLWVPFLYSQEITVTLEDAGISQYQQIFTADFDFLQVGAAEDLFKLVIEKRNFSTDDITYADIYLQLTQNGDQILATMQSNRFQLPPGNGVWRISNKELASKVYDFDGAGTRIIVDAGLSDEVPSIRDNMIETGQLPVGQYVLTTNLTYYPDNTQNGISTTGINEIIITIRNPTLINLVTPGILINSGFKYEIFTENPLFQWNGNSGDYQVVVFKKRNDFDTIDDILNSVPVWESERLTTLFTQYPFGDAIPLEYGSDYVWQVLSFINTSSGENVVRSELFEFTLVDPAQSNVTQMAMARQELEQILRQLLGDKAETILRQINDFKLTSIRVNGATLSIPELYQVLEKYRDQNYDIYDLILSSSN